MPQHTCWRSKAPVEAAEPFPVAWDLERLDNMNAPREFTEELAYKRFPITKEMGFSLLLRKRPERSPVVAAIDEILKPLLLGPLVVIALGKAVLLEPLAAPFNVVPAVGLKEFPIFRAFIVPVIPVHHDPLYIVMSYVAGVHRPQHLGNDVRARPAIAGFEEP